MLLLIAPIAAKAVEQETIDRMINYLSWIEGWDGWNQGVFDDSTLIEGLSLIYDQTISVSEGLSSAGQTGEDEGYSLHQSVILAMGQTGLVEFTPTLMESLEDEPVYACMALKNMPSEDAINALIGMLEHENMHVRDMAVYGLGKFPYYSLFEEEKAAVLTALAERLDKEEEDWVLEDIDAAIVYIQTGEAINAAFADEE